MLLLSNLPLLVLIGYFSFYVVILIISSIHHIRKWNKALTEYKTTGSDGMIVDVDKMSNNDIYFDGNSTDMDILYESKLNIELQKTRYSNQDWIGVDSLTDGQSSVTNTPKRRNNNISMPDLPEIIVEVNEDDIDGVDAEDDNNNEKGYDLCCLSQYSIYFELLLYIMDESTYIASIFVYISYSECDYITRSNFDIYYILFVLSVICVIFYKYISSISIVIITRNCKHFVLQWFDLLIINESLWNMDEMTENGKKIWIKHYLQTFQSIFGSLPQLMISIVFILNSMDNNVTFNINNIIIWSSMGTSLLSLICFSRCNYKITQSFGVYLCRFLEITSRIIILVLIWRYLGALCLSVVIFLEALYLIICSILSCNLLLMSNILYIIYDIYGCRKSKIFIGYRMISTYLFCAIIACLSMTNILQSIDINSYIPSIFNVFNVANYNEDKLNINDKYWFYLFVYSLSVQAIYSIFMFFKYKENIKSIGQCSHFKQLIDYKCWIEIYELMKLGANYGDFSKYNEMNILCEICKEIECKWIHLKIADLYLSKYRDIFLKSNENKFYLPFFYAIQLSSISMINLLICHGADILHLFENADWMNSLQCIISSDYPSMDKIQFLVKRLQQKYQFSASAYDDVIGSFLNYQNGSNYDTALLMLYWTNDYKMMDRGFDRLEAMEYLIWNGADCNILDANKCNILHYAVQENEWRLIKMLIKNGADISQRNGYGEIAISIACKVKCDNMEIIKCLLYGENGNSMNFISSLINRMDNYGRTAMHYAACNCHSDIIKYLIDRNGDCLIKDNDGLTPLHFAMRYNIYDGLQIDVAILLIVVGKTNLNSCDLYNQCTILHDAAKYQSIDIIDYLIKTGANIHCLDQNGHTPKYYSLGRKDENELMEYWKDIYLNNDIYDEILNINKHPNDGDDDELSQLSNLNHLEIFQNIINDEDNDNINNNMINR